MNKEEFLKEKDLLLNSIENNTKEHWENYYKGVPIECIYDDLVIDINEIKRLTEENQKYKEVIFKIKMIIFARIKEYQKKIDNEIDMGSQGDHFKICRYEKNIKFLKDILKEVE